MLNTINHIVSHSLILGLVENARTHSLYRLSSQYRLTSAAATITPAISTTITTGNFRPNIAETTKMPMFNPYNKSEIKEIAPTQTRNCGNINSSAAVLITEDGKYCFRIRKLTPKECWRLMRIFR